MENCKKSVQDPLKVNAKDFNVCKKKPQEVRVM